MNNMNSEHLVTVNILTYNRKEELQNTIEKLYDQDYKNLEIIVIDNASTDNTSKMLQTLYPDIITVQMKKNIGIAGWNEGFKIAKGKFILVLDDDSYPTEGAILQGINIINSNEEIGIVAYNIYNCKIQKSENMDFPTHPSLFIGCGALIKSEVIKYVGGYNELMFIYVNELEYSARCFDYGIKVKYAPEHCVIHAQSMNSRGKMLENPFISEYRFYHTYWGIIVFLLQHFNYRLLPFAILKWIINRSIISVKYKYHFAHLKIIRNLIKNYKTIMENRSVFKYSTQVYFKYGRVYPYIDRDYFPHVHQNIIYKSLKRLSQKIKQR